MKLDILNANNAGKWLFWSFVLVIVLPHIIVRSQWPILFDFIDAVIVMCAVLLFQKQRRRK